MGDGKIVDKDVNVSRHLIYENFILASDTNRTSGFANVNTEYDEVLKAVVNNIPLVPDAYDDALPDGFTHLTDSLPDHVVEAIRTSIKTFDPNTTGISSTNLFDEVFRDKIFNAIWPTVPVADLTDFEKEAFYISAYPAFNSHQQLFAIISKGYVNQSAQYCMAIVWRDPVPDENGYHRCFIREVTWFVNQ